MITVESEEEKFFTKENFLKWKAALISRQGRINVSIIIGLFLFVLLLMKACEPAKGTSIYGVCGAFLEQQIAFPETIEHHYIEQYSDAVRIYYSHIDGFGQYLTEFSECSFETQPQKGLILKGVVFNTIKKRTKKEPLKNKGRLYAIQQEYIDLFNKSNSTEIIIQQEPDTTLPLNDPVFL